MEQPDDAMAELRHPGGGASSAGLRTRDLRREKFLEAIARGSSIRKSCEIASISRTSIARWRAEDPEFTAEFEQAAEDGADRIREEIWRRGVDGWTDTTYDKNGDAHERLVYSDKLLALLAEAKCPEYRARLEAQGSQGAAEIARQLREASLRMQASIPSAPVASESPAVVVIAPPVVT